MATSKTKTDAQLKKLAERVAKLKAEGKRWPEIMSTVKEPEIVKGPASGRRLLRQFGLTDSIIEQTKGKSNGKAKPKGKKAPATAKANPKQKATAQKARRNQPRTKTEKANEVTVRHDPSIIKDKAEAKS